MAVQSITSSMQGVPGWTLLLAVGLGYVLGAIPFGVVVGKVFKGVDVRKYGSGKIGTANVSRSLGLKWGVLVMLLDMGKGVAAVLVARLLGASPAGEALAGLAAVAGHNWSAFIGFTGGRGVSTGVGGLWAIYPLGGLIASIAAFSTMATSRYVSLGSMLGALAGAAALVFFTASGRLAPAYVLYVVVAPLIIFQHRDNIGRLLKGQERKIGQKADIRRAQGEAPSR